MEPGRRILEQFESLGTNCEFGLVLRRFGVETASLLRWGSFQPELEGLLHGLQERFVGAGVDVSVFGDSVSRDNRYGMVFHTGQDNSGIDAVVLWRNEMARIGYLARNLVEELTEARKVFVFKRSKGVTLEWIRSIHGALSAYGPVWLLWVETSEDPALQGSAALIGERLIKGWIDDFSPEEDIYQRCSFEMWLEICRGALAIRDRSGG